MFVQMLRGQAEECDHEREMEKRKEDAAAIAMLDAGRTDSRELYISPAREQGVQDEAKSDAGEEGVGKQRQNAALESQRKVESSAGRDGAEAAIIAAEGGVGHCVYLMECGWCGHAARYAPYSLRTAQTR